MLAFLQRKTWDITVKQSLVLKMILCFGTHCPERWQMQCTWQWNSPLQHVISLNSKSKSYILVKSVVLDFNSWHGQNPPLFTITFGLILWPAHFYYTSVKWHEAYHSTQPNALGRFIGTPLLHFYSTVYMHDKNCKVIKTELDFEVLAVV